MVHRFVILNAATIATNLLPFTGLDGAWLLADAVGVPDLSRRARGAVTRLITAVVTMQPRTKADKAVAVYAAVNGLVALTLLMTAGFFWYQLFGGLVGTLASHGLAGLAALAVAAVVLGRPGRRRGRCPAARRHGGRPRPARRDRLPPAVAVAHSRDRTADIRTPGARPPHQRPARHPGRAAVPFPAPRPASRWPGGRLRDRPRRDRYGGLRDRAGAHPDPRRHLGPAPSAMPRGPPRHPRPCRRRVRPPASVRGRARQRHPVMPASASVPRPASPRRSRVPASVPRPASRVPRPASRVPRPASRVPRPASRVPRPASPQLLLLLGGAKRGKSGQDFPKTQYKPSHPGGGRCRSGVGCSGVEMPTRHAEIQAWRQ